MFAADTAQRLLRAWGQGFRDLDIWELAPLIEDHAGLVKLGQLHQRAYALVYPARDDDYASAYTPQTLRSMLGRFRSSALSVMGWTTTREALSSGELSPDDVRETVKTLRECADALDALVREAIAT